MYFKKFLKTLLWTLGIGFIVFSFYPGEVSLISDEGSETLMYLFPFLVILLVWTPGILAIIYFVKSEMRFELKIILVAILVLIPISGIVIYPLRRRIYKDE